MLTAACLAGKIPGKRVWVFILSVWEARKEGVKEHDKQVKVHVCRRPSPWIQRFLMD